MIHKIITIDNEWMVKAKKMPTKFLTKDYANSPINEDHETRAS